MLLLIPGYDRRLDRIVFLIVLFEMEWDELLLYCRMNVVVATIYHVSIYTHRGSTPGMSWRGVLLTADVLSLRKEDMVAVVICVVVVVAMVASSE